MMSGIDKLKKEELKLWGQIRHPNIVSAFVLFEDPLIDKMYLWMQLADLGSVSVYNEAERTFDINPAVRECIRNKLGTDDREKIVQFIFRGVA
jgi:hypothetical protein